MPSGTGLNILEKALPDQFIDVGIAEEHAACLQLEWQQKATIPSVQSIQLFYNVPLTQSFMI